MKSKSPRKRRKERRLRESRQLDHQIAVIERGEARRRRREDVKRSARERGARIEREVREGLRRAERQSAAARASRDGREGARPRVTHKDLDRMVAAAWRAGLGVRYAGSGHVAVSTPEGRVISIPGTPSRQRTVQRIRLALRRAGVAV